MSNPSPPLAPLDEYFEARPLLFPIRLMNRFFHEVVDEIPECRSHYSAMYGGYMDILNEELAPYALTFALAIVELEDAFPEIKRTTPDEKRDDETPD
jgi:hypothetical protein